MNKEMEQQAVVAALIKARDIGDLELVSVEENGRIKYKVLNGNEQNPTYVWLSPEEQEMYLQALNK